MRRPVALLAVLAGVLAASPAAARAADPILPLDQVQPGQRCTGLSVIRGTEISSFGVEILDVVAETPVSSPRILLRVSGEAIERTGIASGFSGSPVLCRGADGVTRNAGAISETIGEFGALTGLATPIEQVIGTTADPPSDATVRTSPNATSRANSTTFGASGRRVAVRPALFRRARPARGPLTVSGLSPRLGSALRAAAVRKGRAFVAAPVGPLGTFPVQTLRPGSSVSAGYASGDLAVGAIGTVAYTDEDRVYAFGHPFEAAGRRSLLLQDAYVYTVVANPLELEELTAYKLAAPGHDLGAVTNDALNGVVGRIGALPDRTALRVSARDLDTGRVRQTTSTVADEAGAGTPTGVAPIALVGQLAVVQQSATVLDAVPSRQSAEMCLKVRLREAPQPLRLCNRYVVEGVDDGQAIGPLAPLLAADVDAALALVTGAGFADLHVTDVDATVRVRRGMAQAEIVRASAPRRARAGQRIRVELVVRVLRGPLRKVAFTMRVPRVRPGARELRITGEEPDASLSDAAGEIVIDLTAPEEGGLDGEDEEEDGADRVRSLDELRGAFAELERYDGLTAGIGRERGPAYRDPQLRIGGEGTVPIRITR